MKTLAIALILLATSARADADLTTYYEASGYKATPRYAETIEYCRRLAEASPWLRYSTFGVSPQGRDLPLLIADKDGRFEPDRVRRDDKAIILIQAGIHAGEINGKDAGFMLLRDIVVDKAMAALLDHVTIVFIPIFNVDGHERFGPYNRVNQNGPEEMGWRVNAQNLNLNRDYLKADTPEMQNWLRLFQAWDPDFFVDCHATDGADYQYILTYIVELYDNVDPGLAAWSKDVYLGAMEPAMAAAGFEMFPYVYLLQWPNPKAGIQSWVSTPRFANGYVALRNRASLLIETHMLKDYKTRVSATYAMLRHTIELLNREYKGLKKVIAAADHQTAAPDFRRQPFPLQFEADSAAAMIDFKGIAFDTETSDLTGGPWYKFSGEPETFQIKFLDKQRVTVTASLPEAYIIPSQWQTVIERIRLHGIRLARLEEAKTVEVASYRFDNVDWAHAPFEGRHPVTFESTEITQTLTYPAGSVIVDMNQPLARVAAHILEPGGPDSFLLWGFFDAIFEQKEYADSYVMEKLAREMIARDKALLDEFEKKKREDIGFAANPSAMLDWFYHRSPYWDERKDIYPIGKINDRDVLKQLLKFAEEV